MRADIHVNRIRVETPYVLYFLLENEPFVHGRFSFPVRLVISNRIEEILEGNLLVTEGTFWHTRLNGFSPKNIARVYADFTHLIKTAPR
jgi:hypothetical protein